MDKEGRVVTNRQTGSKILRQLNRQERKTDKQVVRY